MNPFTYLVGWSAHGVYYYGVRYGSRADPSSLWTEYKTSSPAVRAFARRHGDPDIVQVRRTFKSANDAWQWERTVIRRMRAASSPRWLNGWNGRSTFRPTSLAGDPETGLLWRAPDLCGQRVILDGREWTRLTPAEFAFTRLDRATWYVVV